MHGENSGAMVAALRRGETVVWLRDAPALPDPDPLSPAEVEDARARFERFAPALAALFPEGEWDGRIASDLVHLPSIGDVRLLAKCDHALPVTGSVKARGGVHEVLHRIEAVARREGLLTDAGDHQTLLSHMSRVALGRERISVASTGNLGFSVGLVASAFGMAAEVHMSHDAKAWKKERLRRLGTSVVEHPCDYAQTSARARAAAVRTGAYFVDDETSRTLMVGYAVAAREVDAQLRAASVVIDRDHPLVVYLPCGVGGAPGGIAAGLKLIYGEAVLPVMVEPTASPCMLAALALNGGEPISVYDLGLDNRTTCDGLAVPRASETVLRAAASAIDAAIALPDLEALAWVRKGWAMGLKLEPSAATALAAVEPLLAHTADDRLLRGTHLVWLTGGSQLPDTEFAAILAG